MDYSYKIGRFSKGIFGTIEKKMEPVEALRIV
jgi:hypothetical protein